MLNFTDVALHRGGRQLFAGVSFTVHAGQRVGITGANGTGKSSLLALVRGELHTDTGDIGLPPAAVIAHVAQETPAVDTPAIEYVIDGDAELRDVEAALRAAESADDGHRQAELHARFDAIDGYSARARAGRLMHGLGFGDGEEERPVRSFSGGWRMRLNLARALMCRSDLLLLDEPTNHLDLDAVLWLEEWLRGYPGTLLLISHDRDFLDRVVTHIAHLERGALTLYTGNYSKFEVRRAEQLAGQQAAYERQQREVARIHRFVERFRAKATKARQAQSRLKMLDRLELIAPAHADSPFDFGFREPEKLPRPLLTLEHAAAGYGDRPVVDGIDLSIVPGDRIGLLGPNGAGKSTVVKLLAGELTPLSGKRQPAAELRIGYFAQHQLEQLREQDSPLLHLARLAPKESEQTLRDFLGGFAFAGDMATGPVGPLSGGEKARLVLALLVWQRPNLLLLDEPTNHLDLEMRHALTVALQEFNGALVVVSHDRHLLRSTTDELLLVADGRVRPFDGDLEAYRNWLAERRRARGETPSGPAAGGAADRKERKRREAELRQRLAPLRRDMERLEREVERLGARKAELEQALADPALYEEAGKERLQKLLREQGEVERGLAEKEEAWMNACEAYEEATAREA